MYNKLSYALLTGALLAVSSVSASAGEGHRKHHFWEHHDADGDGQVTREEFLQTAEERFSKIDANGDSVITKDEMKAMHDKFMEKRKKMKEKE